MSRFLFLIFTLFSIVASAQYNVGIGTPNPDPSSLLELSSGSKGLLVPRMTTVQRLAITTPAKGLLVYDTDLVCFYYFDVLWKSLCQSGIVGPTGATGITGTTGPVGITGPTGPTILNALNQDGVVVGPTSTNANQVWGTDAAGNPAWVNAASTITNKKDVTSLNPILSITNGTQQVFGPNDIQLNLTTGTVTTTTNGVTVGGTGNTVGANVTLDVATNGLNQPGLVPGPIPADSNKVWGTDAAGNPAWVNAASTITNKKDVTSLNPILSITNGTQQVFGPNDIQLNLTTGTVTTTTNGVTVGGTGNTVGANVTLDVATNGLNQPGLVPGPIPADSNKVWGTDAAGNPGWVSPTSLVSVDNGLYYNGVAGKIRQGGALVENTTITEGNFNYIHSLSGTGVLEARNSATVGSGLIVTPNNRVGIRINSTTPLQDLDVNGRINVASGVIQRGTTQITATTDLGLYSQPSGNWIRFATNEASIKFFHDQGGAAGVGTNAIMNIDNASGGGVAIGANTVGATNPNPDASAVLDLQSTTKGFMVPRMTTAERNAIAVSAAREGLLIYNTDNDCFEWWDTKATAGAGSGFWNSLCRWCEDAYTYSSSNNGNNFFVQAGSPTAAKKWCVYVNSGVTLGANTAGGTALNFSSLPGGSEVVVYNSGTIIGGGGNGADGGQESDAICSGDGGGGTGQNGGDAIGTSSSVKVFVINYGFIAGGGGGGGGGSGGCRARGGGGGGGRGIPGGGAGSGATSGGRKANGTFCTGCTSSGASANPGNAGSGAAPGTGGCGTGNSGGGCFSGAYNGGCGGSGGGYGAAGGNGNGGTCGSIFSSGGAWGNGGAAGFALRGNSAGCAISNIGGSYIGTVQP